MKKTGKDNLVPMSERTPEDQHRIAMMGGIASGAARREKRRTLDMIEAWLAATADDEDGLSNEDAYIRAVIRRAQRTGSTDLLELLAKLRGELVQKSEIDLNGTIPAVLTDDMLIDDYDDEPEEKPKRKSRAKKA